MPIKDPQDGLGVRLLDRGACDRFDLCDSSGERSLERSAKE